MTITRWIPRHPSIEFDEDLNRLWSQFHHDSREDVSQVNFLPPVDIEEQEKVYHVAVELPGVKKSNVKVNIEDNVLTVSGEKNSSDKVKDENYHRVERSYGKFRRCFRLPELVDQNKIAAEFKDGILNIDIPKLEEALPKEIEIKVN